MIINKSSLKDYAMMLKWSLDLSQSTHWDFFQLPTATWHSSQFPDSVFQISHSKILFAVSKSPDLFNPSPKYVLKFSQFNLYLSQRRLVCNNWITLLHGQVFAEGPAAAPAAWKGETSPLQNCCYFTFSKNQQWVCLITLVSQACCREGFCVENQ